jgi:hypothetical protein
MTWSAPVAVAPPETHDQFFPWLAVDHRTCSAGCGEVGVSWLDRKNDPSNISYQAFAAVSSNGTTFSAPRLISSGGIESPLNDGFGGHYMGDYSGACWSYKKIGTTTVGYYHAAWTDTRNGSTAQAWVGGLSIP